MKDRGGNVRLKAAAVEQGDDGSGDREHRKSRGKGEHHRQLQYGIDAPAQLIFIAGRIGGGDVGQRGGAEHLGDRGDKLHQRQSE